MSPDNLSSASDQGTTGELQPGFFLPMKKLSPMGCGSSSLWLYVEVLLRCSTHTRFLFYIVAFALISCIPRKSEWVWVAVGLVASFVLISLLILLLRGRSV